MLNKIILSAFCVWMASVVQAQKPGTPPKAAPKPPVAVKPAVKPKPQTSVKTMKDDTIRLEGGVKMIRRKSGTGRKPQVGEKVIAHYTGTLPNGKKFDSSRDRNEPFSFELVTGSVIQGWHIGFAAMNKGDQALLIIPAESAYGDREFKDETTGEVKIPKNSVLHFDVELLDIQTPNDFIPFSEEGKEILTTPGGIRYYFVQKNNGRVPQIGQKVTFHFQARMAHGFMLEDSRSFEKPMGMKLGSGKMIPVFEEVLQLMKVGEKAVFLCPPEKAFGNRQVGPVPPNSTMVFEMELLDAQDAVSPKPFDVTGKDTVKFPNGMQMIWVEKGADTTPITPMTTAVVHYSGYLTNMKMFDSSIERDEPFNVTLGTGSVIPGWEEALGRMHKNDKVRVIIPPQLGYHTQEIKNPVTGQIDIPANSTLIFDMEVLDIRKSR